MTAHITIPEYNVTVCLSTWISWGTDRQMAFCQEILSRLLRYAVFRAKENIANHSDIWRKVPDERKQTAYQALIKHITGYIPTYKYASEFIDEFKDKSYGYNIMSNELFSNLVRIYEE